MFLGKITDLAPLSNSGFGQINTLKIGDFAHCRASCNLLGSVKSQKYCLF
jgi:hypothetical protein